MQIPEMDCERYEERRNMRELKPQVKSESGGFPANAMRSIKIIFQYDILNVPKGTEPSRCKIDGNEL